MTEADARRGAALPQLGRGLTRRRRGGGLLLGAAALPALTGVLVAVRGELALGSVLLLYLVAVVAISVVGGIVAGSAAAVASFLMANFFLTPPFHTFVVEDRDSVIALLVFLGVAVTVSVLVDVAARRQAAVVRSEAEGALLARLTAEPLAGSSAEDVLAEVATTFGLDSVVLLDREDSRQTVVARVGPVTDSAPTVKIEAGGRRMLHGHGRQLFAEDRRLLGRLAHAASRAVDARALAGEASRARELAEVDRLRSALLAAVGHDLRTPLAAIKAAAATLHQPDIHLDDAERDDLLTTIESGADRLTDLIANLLDLSRLEAGALKVDLEPVSLDEVVGRILIDRQAHAVQNRITDDEARVLADAGLLERVLANLVDNARKHAPDDSPVIVDARRVDDRVVISVVDRGPGVAEGDWQQMFVPFQRLHDHRSDTGIGLGLAIARGFTEAMGGTLEPAHTPGGGLTMSLTLPRAQGVSPGGEGGDR